MPWGTGKVAAWGQRLAGLRCAPSASGLACGGPVVHRYNTGLIKNNLSVVVVAERKGFEPSIQLLGRMLP